MLFDQCLELEDHPGRRLEVDHRPGGLRGLGGRYSLRKDCGVSVLQGACTCPVSGSQIGLVTVPVRVTC